MIVANYFPTKLDVNIATSPLSPYTGTPIARELVDHPLYEGPTTVTPTEETQTLPTDGYLMGDDITVDAIPADYVGSSIPERGSDDLTASGATVNVPAGYYEEDASKMVGTGSASPPATIGGTSATYSTAGDWMLRFTKNITVTPEVVAGFVSSGTAGTVEVTLSAMHTNFVASNIRKNVEIFGKVGTYEGGGSYPWYGGNTIYYVRVLNRTINLKNDTTFDSWTASTTAGTIKAASTTNDWTCDVDKENTWWFITRVYVDVAFKSGATLTKTVRRLVAYHTNILAAYPSTNANLIINNRDIISSFSQTARGGIRYYTSTENTLGFTPSYTYGPMYMANTPSLSISGTTVSCKLPALYARCNPSYFATARKTEVDSANTNMTITVDVYKTPIPNTYLAKHIDNVTADLTDGL